MKIIERNLQEIGKSLLVTLPKYWTSSLKLKKGSKIKMLVSSEGNLLIAPEFTRERERRETTIVYDQFLERKFFREYFFSNEKITILLPASMKKTDREDLYHFLKQFINVQIIEDTRDRVVIKCFKIDDLSINECLKRMYHLSLSLFDEKNPEIKATSKRFYYMLVMQIRRFLCEGQYTKNNDISLLGILDLRMVSEKIARITSLILEIDEIRDDRLKEVLAEVKNYYQKSFQYFLTNDYEKAIQLWAEEKIIHKNLNKELLKIKQSNNIELFQQAKDIKQVLLDAKSITMHVRGNLK